MRTSPAGGGRAPSAECSIPPQVAFRTQDPPCAPASTGLCVRSGGTTPRRPGNGSPRLGAVAGRASRPGMAACHRHRGPEGPGHGPHRRVIFNVAPTWGRFVRCGRTVQGRSLAWQRSSDLREESEWASATGQAAPGRARGTTGSDPAGPGGKCRLVEKQKRLTMVTKQHYALRRASRPLTLSPPRRMPSMCHEFDPPWNAGVGTHAGGRVPAADCETFHRNGEDPPGEHRPQMVISHTARFPGGTSTPQMVIRGRRPGLRGSLARLPPRSPRTHLTRHAPWSGLLQCR